jgi:hypothetical protein
MRFANSRRYDTLDPRGLPDFVGEKRVIRASWAAKLGDTRSHGLPLLMESAVLAQPTLFAIGLAGRAGALQSDRWMSRARRHNTLCVPPQGMPCENDSNGRYSEQSDRQGDMVNTSQREEVRNISGSWRIGWRIVIAEREPSCSEEL